MGQLCLALLNTQNMETVKRIALIVLAIIVLVFLVKFFLVIGLVVVGIAAVWFVVTYLTNILKS